MKKVLSLIGLVVLGASAVGCSADVTDEGSIGTTSQALSVNGSPSGSLSSGQERKFSASCTLQDSVTPFATHYIYAGGLDTAGNAQEEIFDSTNGTSFTTLGGGVQLGTARYNLVAFAPDANTCVFIGGTTSGTTRSTAVDVVTVASGTFTVTNAQALGVARELSAVTKCGSKLMVVGGLNSSSNGIETIEVSDAFNPTSWTRYDNATLGAAPPQRWLNTARGNFALVKDGSNDRYVVAGGKGPANLTATVEVITTSSCVPTVTDVSAAAGIGLTNAAEGNVGFLPGAAGSTTMFVLAGGRQSGSTLATTADEITIDWSTLGDSTANAMPPTITGAYRSMLALGGGKYQLISGSNAQESAGITAVQQYSSGSWSSVNLTVAHYGGVAQLLGSTIYVAAGDTFSGSPSLATVIDEITP